MGWILAFCIFVCAKPESRTPRRVDKAAWGRGGRGVPPEVTPGPGLCLPDQMASADETAARVDVPSFHSGGTDLTQTCHVSLSFFPFFLCPLFLALLPIDLFACSGTSVGCHA